MQTQKYERNEKENHQHLEGPSSNEHAMLLVSCGDGDSTVSNWFFAIIVILALLKKT